MGRRITKVHTLWCNRFIDYWVVPPKNQILVQKYENADKASFVFQIKEINACVNTEANGKVTLDIFKNGISIFGTNKLTIDANEESSETADVKADFTAKVFNKRDKMTFEVTEVDGTAPKGLQVYYEVIENYDGRK